MKVKGKVVVITGASSGIGRATALAFAERKANVVAAARGRPALDSVVAECAERGGAGLAVPVDVTDAKAVDELARRAVERFGRIDVWVNCAAVSVYGEFTEVPLEDFRRVLDVNVMGYVHGVRAALPYMRRQGKGVIVNVASIAGVVTQPYAHPYAMSKFAVRAMSASLRQELALRGERGVKVCAVLPATIDTPFFQHAGNYTGRRVRAMPPVYTPERVARTIVDLVRLPRREVVVGPLGRGMVLQSRIAPALVERMMAGQADRSHLSRKERAEDTSGILYEPPAGTGTVTGGWHGRRKTAVRRGAAMAALAAGGAWRLLRGSPAGAGGPAKATRAAKAARAAGVVRTGGRRPVRSATPRITPPRAKRTLVKLP
ncbi:SDR family oxidoreductase [Thermomonospora amylolytica]|uniref:SDR family oxidoreductase n=1 Tax=Thermomonospora amylolytica TaxID=1411117 RepID=UPI000E6C035E|nr:SDR family oxidoreductase [Thermomonospora amylolytica]